MGRHNRRRRDEGEERYHQKKEIKDSSNKSAKYGKYVLEEQETRWAQSVIVKEDIEESLPILEGWRGKIMDLILCPNANHCVTSALRCCPFSALKFIMNELQEDPEKMLTAMMHRFACRCYCSLIRTFGSSSEHWPMGPSGSKRECLHLLNLCVKKNFDIIAWSTFGCYVVSALMEHCSGTDIGRFCLRRLKEAIFDSSLLLVENQGNGPLVALCLAAAKMDDEVLRYMESANEKAEGRRYRFLPFIKKKVTQLKLQAEARRRLMEEKEEAIIDAPFETTKREDEAPQEVVFSGLPMTTLRHTLDPETKEASEGNALDASAFESWENYPLAEFVYLGIWTYYSFQENQQNLQEGHCYHEGGSIEDVSQDSFSTGLGGDPTSMTTASPSERSVSPESNNFSPVEFLFFYGTHDEGEGGGSRSSVEIAMKWLELRGDCLRTPTPSECSELLVMEEEGNTIEI